MKELRIIIYIIPLLFACSDTDNKSTIEEAGSRAELISFQERSAELGVDFVHYNGMYGDLLMPEILGSGVALLDFDRDDDLDILFVQGNRLNESIHYSQSTFPPSDSTYLSDQLFRNNLDKETLSFSDITTESGINSFGYGMGAAIGDVNNDGFPDIYITNYGENLLYQNQGNGSFSRMYEELNSARWGTAASFIDIDRDGFLDLYLGNYLDYRIGANVQCTSQSGLVDYCGPLSYEASNDILFRNKDGKGYEAIELLGSDIAGRASLGSVTLAGGSSLYIANDAHPNTLLKGDPNELGDRAVMMGLSVNAQGASEGSMGIAAGDFDSDGDEDLLVTHLKEETNTLYRQDNGDNYYDESSKFSIGFSSRNYTGFGVAWIDINNDGHLDLVVLNGSIRRLIADHPPDHPFPLTERNQIYLARPDGLEELRGLDIVERREVSRGLAIGDLDNDGDSDLVISNNSGRAEIWLNESGHKRSWLGLSMINKFGRNDSGAVVELKLSSGKKLMRVARRDGSYLSSSDPRVLFGLGEETEIVDLIITWSDGSKLAVDPRTMALNSYNEIRQ